MALEIMLAQQVLAVVVALRSANDGVDVLMRGLVCPGAAQAGGVLVVERDEHNGAVDAIIKDAGGVGAADPGEVSSVNWTKSLLSAGRA